MAATNKNGNNKLLLKWKQRLKFRVRKLRTLRIKSKSRFAAPHGRGNRNLLRVSRWLCPKKTTLKSIIRKMIY